MRVAIFPTCLGDAMFPRAPIATVRVLERLGVEVDFPSAQTCCGQMHFNTGYADDGLDLAATLVDALAGFDHVVGPSGSCVGSIRHQSADIARRRGRTSLGDAIDDLAARTFELSEFLVDVLDVTDVGASFPHSVTYHPTCHSMRMLGVGDRPVQLLRAVRGLHLRELQAADECCGFGGTFALKNAAVSSAMGADKARHVRNTGAEVLVAGDASCLLHIGGVLSRQESGVRVMHLAEVLAATDARPDVAPGADPRGAVPPMAPVPPRAAS
ncbi:MAG TPA: (Fe-S)-binding protein [Nitriliruptoraceae bacterium]|nr:(Fe-S)-binding protein [Nitriliruptoraceae bacterium]